MNLEYLEKMKQKILKKVIINKLKIMEIKGTISKKLKLESGTSKAGKEWKKLDVIIQQPGEYGTAVCITAFGDQHIESINRFNIGDSIEVSVNIESREFNGRYYTNIGGWKWSNSIEEIAQEEKSEGLPF